MLVPITLCYIRSAVVLLGFPAYSFSLFTILALYAIVTSLSILAIYVTLDRSKAYICFVYWSWHICFTSWLDNIDEFRCSTAKIASILWPCFDLASYSLSSVGGLLLSSSLVWNTANWIFNSSNRKIRLWARFGQENGASERDTLEKPRGERSSWRNSQKPSRKVLHQFIFHQICWTKPYLLNGGNRQDDKRCFWSWFALSKADLNQILEPSKLPIF